MIREALDGRRIGVTGATGFLGTAVVERLLRTVPGCRLVLLVRPGRRTNAQRRVEREILRNNAFDRLRRELGDRFDQQMAERVDVVAGDVGTDGLGLDDADRETFASCDVVIHSAATVAFDSPIDSSVEVNLLGPSRVAGQLTHDTHLVAVSTCYVAANQRGAAPERLLTESPFMPDLDWRAEVAAAGRARADAEAESRDPAELARFRKEARARLGAAGSPLLAERTERLRGQWVRDTLVEAGRARARSLGWPDVYSYTKALGEVALLESRRDVPLTLVRPSIIESALEEPHPGWIRGFRMAEPVIISYGRGLLRDFPGIPEGIVDVIPVDLVAAALCAIAATGADDEPSVYQVASGSTNPLRYRRLVDLVREWYTEHPLYDSGGQPIVVPEWTFPGRGKVQGQLQRAKRTLDRAERILNQLPLRGKRAEVSARLEERREQADRALGYVELYASYAEVEAVFGVQRLLRLSDELDRDDRDTFCFDPRVVDWRQFLHDVHLPSIVEHARVRSTPGTRQAPVREERLRAAVLSEDRHLAAFDLENTLIASNVVESYAWLASRRLASGDRPRLVARLLMEAPSLLALDRRDRGDFLRHFYRRYEGAPIEQLDQDARELFSRLLLAKSFPAGIRRVREHRARGHRTVLITGALDFVIEPLRPLFDDVVCARLSTVDGTYTGELESAPPTGEARAIAMADYADAEGLSLSESVAYADSASDLPMLEAVGFPVAVNPETRLAALARSRGWLVENWTKSPGATSPMLPLAPAR